MNRSIFTILFYYSLPNINVENINDWYEELYALQNEDHLFVTFADQNGSFVFENLNILNEDIKSFHGIFKTDSLLNSTLLLIKNKNNSDFFKIYTTDSGDIFYKINVSGTETTLHEAQYVVDQYLEIGVDLEKIISHFGKDVATFFGNKNALKLILLNNDNNDSCFSIDLDFQQKIITNYSLCILKIMEYLKTMATFMLTCFTIWQVIH